MSFCTPTREFGGGWRALLVAFTMALTPSVQSDSPARYSIWTAFDGLEGRTDVL